MKLDIDVEKVNYIKILYKDKDNFTHCIKAALKSLNEREIIASAKFEEGFLIDVPQDVAISIACDNGLFKATTQLKFVTKEEPYLIFNIVTPQEIDYQQKREFFRVKINENALIKYVSDGEIVNIACETFDLSGNGVRLVIDKNYSLPEKVQLVLYLPRKTIETDAKYIRTDEEDKILKASFSFENLKDVDLDCITQICFQKQLELRRKTLL